LVVDPVDLGLSDRVLYDISQQLLFNKILARLLPPHSKRNVVWIVLAPFLLLCLQQQVVVYFMVLLPLFGFFAVHGHHFNKVLFVHVLAEEVAEPKHLRAILSDRSFNLAFRLQSPPHRRLLGNVLLLQIFINLHSFQAITLV
jgi:hypothetical protein